MRLKLKFFNYTSRKIWSWIQIVLSCPLAIISESLHNQDNIIFTKSTQLQAGIQVVWPLRISLNFARRVSRSACPGLKYPFTSKWALLMTTASTQNSCRDFNPRYSRCDLKSSTLGLTNSHTTNAPLSPVVCDGNSVDVVPEATSCDLVGFCKCHTRDLGKFLNLNQTWTNSLLYFSSHHGPVSIVLANLLACSQKLRLATSISVSTSLRRHLGVGGRVEGPWTKLTVPQRLST